MSSYIVAYTYPVILDSLLGSLHPKIIYVDFNPAFSPMLTWRLLRPVHTLRSTWTKTTFCAQEDREGPGYTLSPTIHDYTIGACKPTTDTITRLPSTAGAVFVYVLRRVCT